MRLLIKNDYFSNEELEQWGVLQEENTLVSAIIGEKEKKLFIKYCFVYSENRSEILRNIISQNIQEPEKILELSKEVTKIEQPEKITCLVPISQKKEIKRFVQHYKKEYKMSESLLIRLSILAFLKEIYQEGVTK